ncbi:MAG: 2-succinyl-5-enolpyruvyl-6-hydroxy-3-cyclohexene-1-carboxylic-acid synthase [Actinobacteria bacterium]|nr:2-succinyl-5-enolpyruvyl-6-hydroxy-3-cyclohexene-1-carboxylic-acid synthase [Actinomycetota bacterium]
MNTSTGLARGIVLKLIESGITDVVLSPGSRNAPISIALYAAEERGLLTLHIRIDERTAGFFALGIAKASKRPVALLCTSGTAVANYHPSVLEAHHSQIPLLVITADRPARLRQTGSNQTTLQSGIYGAAASLSADVASLDFNFDEIISKLQDGPVHLNVQLDEPLLPDDESDWLHGAQPGLWSTGNQGEAETLELSQPRGVIVLGHDRAGFSVDEIARFADEIGWPLIAEDPLSFSKALPHASIFLSSQRIRELLRPDVAIVVGRTTLSRAVNALVKSAGREFVIDPRTARIDQKRVATEIFLSIPEVRREFEDDSEWMASWSSQSAAASEILAALPEWSEQSIARAIGSNLPTNTTLFISSSRPIRDLEGFAAPRDGVETFANRGLAGIDGNISTALGIASQRKSAIALLGDLSFLHDLSGLIGASGINLRIVLINNDGGGIFSTLPQNEVRGFEKIFGTPHGLDLAAISASFGVETRTVLNVDQLVEALIAPIYGLSIVLANVPSRDENARVLRELTGKLDTP